MGFFSRFKKDYVSEYATQIFTVSVQASQTISKIFEDHPMDEEGRELGNDELISVLFEFIYFFLHLTDRFAFGQMNEERRGSLMISLEDKCFAFAIGNLFEEMPKDKKSELMEICMGNFFARVGEYSQYSM